MRKRKWRLWLRSSVVGFVLFDFNHLFLTEALPHHDPIYNHYLYALSHLHVILSHLHHHPRHHDESMVVLITTSCELIIIIIHARLSPPPPHFIPPIEHHVFFFFSFLYASIVLIQNSCVHLSSVACHDVMCVSSPS